MKANAVWILNILTTTTRRRWRNRNGGVKTAVWRTFTRRLTLRHAVKNKRVTVQGPVKRPQMDYISHTMRDPHATPLSHDRPPIRAQGVGDCPPVDGGKAHDAPGAVMARTALRRAECRGRHMNAPAGPRGRTAGGGHGRGARRGATGGPTGPQTWTESHA